MYLIIILQVIRYFSRGLKQDGNHLDLAVLTRHGIGEAETLMMSTKIVRLNDSVI